MGWVISQKQFASSKKLHPKVWEELQNPKTEFTSFYCRTKDQHLNENVTKLLTPPPQKTYRSF